MNASATTSAGSPASTATSTRSRQSVSTFPPSQKKYNYINRVRCRIRFRHHTSLIACGMRLVSSRTGRANPEVNRAISITRSGNLSGDEHRPFCAPLGFQTLAHPAWTLKLDGRTG